MATTVKEIALAAGVSKAAVSKVLHNSSTSVRVSEERATLIRQIASDLGYIPNANARILKTNRSQTIGVYFEHLAEIASGPLYLTHLLDGICQVLFKHHYRPALLAELEDDAVANCLGDGRLDGIIWCRVVRDAPTIEVMHKSPIPIVGLNMAPSPGNGNVMFVRCDNVGGMEFATAHLWDLGHRKILFVREIQEKDVADCVDRVHGFTEAMARRGAIVAVEDVVTWSWFLDEFADWWASNPPHTAVICWSESCAGRFLSQCLRNGVRVPQELSVVGFDSTSYCNSTVPKLTAVRQPIIEMGALSARLILQALEGKKIAELVYTLPCDFDIRESTASPRR